MKDAQDGVLDWCSGCHNPTDKHTCARSLAGEAERAQIIDDNPWAEIGPENAAGGTVRIDWLAAKTAIAQHVHKRKFDSYRDAVFLRRLADKIANDVNDFANPQRVAIGWKPFVGNEMVEQLMKEDDERNKR